MENKKQKNSFFSERFLVYKEGPGSSINLGDIVAKREKDLRKKELAEMRAQRKEMKPEDREALEAVPDEDYLVDVPEEKVAAAENALERRLKESPLDDRHKRIIWAKFDALKESRVVHINNSDTLHVLRLTAYETIKRLNKFEEDNPKIGEMVRALEPMYAKKGKIIDATNLVCMRVGGGYPEVIASKVGMGKAQIKDLQRFFGIKATGVFDLPLIRHLAIKLGVGKLVKPSSFQTLRRGETIPEEMKMAWELGIPLEEFIGLEAYQLLRQKRPELFVEEQNAEQANLQREEARQKLMEKYQAPKVEQALESGAAIEEVEETLEREQALEEAEESDEEQEVVVEISDEARANIETFLKPFAAYMLIDRQIMVVMLKQHLDKFEDPEALVAAEAKVGQFLQPIKALEKQYDVQPNEFAAIVSQFVMAALSGDPVREEAVKQGFSQKVIANADRYVGGAFPEAMANIQVLEQRTQDAQSLYDDLQAEARGVQRNLENLTLENPNLVAGAIGGDNEQAIAGQVEEKFANMKELQIAAMELSAQQKQLNHARQGYELSKYQALQGVGVDLKLLDEYLVSQAMTGNLDTDTSANYHYEYESTLLEAQARIAERMVGEDSDASEFEEALFDPDRMEKVETVEQGQAKVELRDKALEVATEQYNETSVLDVVEEFKEKEKERALATANEKFVQAAQDPIFDRRVAAYGTYVYDVLNTLLPTNDQDLKRAKVLVDTLATEEFLFEGDERVTELEKLVVALKQRAALQESEISAEAVGDVTNYEVDPPSDLMKLAEEGGYELILGKRRFDDYDPMMRAEMARLHGSRKADWLFVKRDEQGRIMIKTYFQLRESDVKQHEILLPEQQEETLVAEDFANPMLDLFGGKMPSPELVEKLGMTEDDLRRLAQGELVLSEEQIQMLTQQRVESQVNLSLAIKTNPSIKFIQTAGAGLASKLGNLQRLFSAGMRGNRTEDFVRAVREDAFAVHKDLGSVRSQIVQARADLTTLRSFSSGARSDAFERQITALSRQLDKIDQASAPAEKLVKQIYDRAITHPDTFSEWFVRKALPVLAAIGAAIAAMFAFKAIVAGTGIAALSGTGLMATATQAGVMGAGSLFGLEVAKTVGSVAFDTGIDSDMQLYLAGKIDHKTLLTNYAVQWGLSSAASFIFIRIGMALGPRIATMAEKDVFFLSNLCRGIQKASYTLKLNHFNPQTTQGKMALEYASELMDHTVEEMGRGTPFEVLASAFNALDGRRVSIKGVNYMGMERTGRNSARHISYYNGLVSRESLVENLQGQYGEANVTFSEITGEVNVVEVVDVNGRPLRVERVFFDNSRGERGREELPLGTDVQVDAMEEQGRAVREEMDESMRVFGLNQDELAARGLRSGGTVAMNVGGGIEPFTLRLTVGGAVVLTSQLDGNQTRMGFDEFLVEANEGRIMSELEVEQKREGEEAEARMDIEEKELLLEPYGIRDGSTIEYIDQNGKVAKVLVDLKSGGPDTVVAMNLTTGERRALSMDEFLGYVDRIQETETAQAEPESVTEPEQVIEPVPAIEEELVVEDPSKPRKLQRDQDVIEEVVEDFVAEATRRSQDAEEAELKAEKDAALQEEYEGTMKQLVAEVENDALRGKTASVVEALWSNDIANDVNALGRLQPQVAEVVKQLRKTGDEKLANKIRDRFESLHRGAIKNGAWEMNVTEDGKLILENGKTGEKVETTVEKFMEGAFDLSPGDTLVNTHPDGHDDYWILSFTDAGHVRLTHRNDLNDIVTVSLGVFISKYKQRIIRKSADNPVKRKAKENAREVADNFNEGDELTLVGEGEKGPSNGWVLKGVKPGETTTFVVERTNNGEVERQYVSGEDILLWNGTRALEPRLRIARRASGRQLFIATYRLYAEDPGVGYVNVLDKQSRTTAGAKRILGFAQNQNPSESEIIAAARRLEGDVTLANLRSVSRGAEVPGIIPNFKNIIKVAEDTLLRDAAEIYTGDINTVTLGRSGRPRQKEGEEDISGKMAFAAKALYEASENVALMADLERHAGTLEGAREMLGLDERDRRVTNSRIESQPANIFPTIERALKKNSKRTDAKAKRIMTVLNTARDTLLAERRRVQDQGAAEIRQQAREDHERDLQEFDARFQAGDNVRVMPAEPNNPRTEEAGQGWKIEDDWKVVGKEKDARTGYTKVKVRSPDGSKTMLIGLKTFLNMNGGSAGKDKKPAERSPKTSSTDPMGTRPIDLP